MRKKQRNSTRTSKAHLQQREEHVSTFAQKQVQAQRHYVMYIA